MQRNKNSLKLTSKDFAGLFGTEAEELDALCADLISGFDFHYRKLELEERDNLILGVLKEINSKDLAKAGRHRCPDWDRGWGENLKEFIASGYDVDKLIPKYFKKIVPVRLNRDYVLPFQEDFVVNVVKVFRSWLFKKYIQGVDSVYEFGCGAAQHLVFLAQLYPDKKLYGFDWVRSSQEIIRLLAQHYRWKIKGENFDFFNPNRAINIKPNSAVYTFSALEQVGKKYGSFLDFLLQKSPEICINVEGFCELYELDYLLDYLAFKYHKRRNYLDGFLTRLKKLEKMGRIEIIKVHHLLFGNLSNDSFSYCIWRPKTKNRYVKN